jgi:hypothetical protein
MAKRPDQDKPGLPEATEILIGVIAEAAADAVRHVAAEIRGSDSIEAFFGTRPHPRGDKPGGSTSEAEGGASSGSGARGPRGTIAPAARRGGNDDRSNALNPNSPEHRAAANNRSNQMNSNNSAYKSSRGGGR